MAKKKESTLKSWDEADEKIKRLGGLQIEKTRLEGELQTKVNELKAEYTAKAGLLAAEAKEIEKDITRFCEQHKDEFLKTRNKKLNFGTVSYRLVERVSYTNAESVIKAIKHLNLDHVLRIKEEIDKDEIKTLDANILTKIGVSIVKEDKISIDPDMVKLAAAAK